ncbi:zinc-ribbon domain-containing protein [Roseovarius amoyensis]|uniref:zinc-ribbon domain-containing protein n=1 Tax=Roseovarius amoyensis TaxID=2211448 RepID=UPI000DBE3616|nr:zinc-ribbon domain-containing protein [Roseovarius amoyensis]
MRLTCPNCGAQYEVPDEVIPENGRDVQCSNCGETWFQAHGDDAPPEMAADYEPAGADDETGQDWPEPQGDDTAEPAPDEEPQAAQRRGLDDDVASVLREEAKREAQARAAEAAANLESQPDLGLSEPQDDTDQRSHQARARIARLQGTADPQPEPVEDDINPGSRRDLLPDIDEINSTFAADTPSDSDDSSARDGTRATDQPARGGFGRGLRMAILLALIATALYLFAPQLADAVPALADPLATYVGAVDQLRVMLNEQVSGMLAQP